MLYAEDDSQQAPVIEDDTHTCVERLPLLVDGHSQKEYVVDRSPFTIGRVPGNDLALPYRCLSRRHCRIFSQGEDFFVEDSGSTNGTYLGDRRLTGPAKLSDGDVIQVKMPPGRERDGWKATFRIRYQVTHENDQAAAG